MRLYLDDCAYDSRLRDILSGPTYNHYVVIPIEAGIRGVDDDLHFAYARSHDLILVTKNPRDFLALHRATPDHPGILLIYQDNRPSDMHAADIAHAIQNLADAGVPIPNSVHELNRWRY
jgi:predicted nuclease of predicted toxin-antitoxin system